MHVWLWSTLNDQHYMGHCLQAAPQVLQVSAKLTHSPHTQHTALNLSQGKDWKFTAAKTTPFLDLLSDEDKKGTEEGPLQGKRLCVFPPEVFTYF